MTERHLTILQITDLHDCLESHPKIFRSMGEFTYRTDAIAAEAGNGWRSSTDGATVRRSCPVW